jgi:hypothetical protein
VDQEDTVSGAPVAGSPEVQDFAANPTGGDIESPHQHRAADVPFYVMAGEADNGRFNEASGQFE